jgi:hypothetical protein
MNDLFDLSSDVAVVIGATGVLGGALADGLAAAGANVAVLGRSEERGRARVEAIRGAGGRADFFTADAMSRESLAEAHRAIEKTLGAPTILVNAAGGNDPKVTVTAENAFAAITVENWRANFDLNLVGGALLPCQEFGPAMVARKRGAPAAVARGDLLGGEGGGAELDAIPRARVGAERRARELAHAGILSRRAKPAAAFQRGRFADAARAVDSWPHADGAVRAVGRVDRRGGFPREREGECVCHGDRPARGWGLSFADDLSFARRNAEGRRTAEGF